MNDDLLTFELSTDAAEIYVHGNPEGLERLAKTLMHLAKQARSGELPHDHLFTENWGGEELSIEAQSQESNVINHVKLYCWPTKEGAKPYEQT